MRLLIAVLHYSLLLLIRHWHRHRKPLKRLPLRILTCGSRRLRLWLLARVALSKSILPRLLILRLVLIRKRGR